MSGKTGNLFTHKNIEEIIGILKVDLDNEDQYEAVFQAKVKAMERLLRFGMSKFSKDRLYQHLTVVARRVAVQKKGQPMSDKVTTRLHSMGHLKVVIQNLRSKEKYGGLMECEKQTIKYFDNFFVDVEHVRRIKCTFDREIHTVLYYDYFKPSENYQTPSQKKYAKEKKPNDRINYSVSEKDEKHTKKLCRVSKKSLPPHRSKASRSNRSPKNKHESALSSVGFSCSQHLRGSEYEKLYVTVAELENVSERWGRLLMDDQQDLKYYDPESYYEVMDSTEHSQFEIIFRLFPDIFAKCYKIIELSKQWWNLAHTVYKTLPLKRPISRGWPRQSVMSPGPECEVEKEKAHQETDTKAQIDTVVKTKYDPEIKLNAGTETGTLNKLETDKEIQLEREKKYQAQTKPTQQTTGGKFQQKLNTKSPERTINIDDDTKDNKEAAMWDLQGGPLTVSENPHGHHEKREKQYVRTNDNSYSEKSTYVLEIYNIKKRERIRNIKARLFDLSYAMKECTDELDENRLIVMKLDSRERRFQMLQILSCKANTNLEALREAFRKTRAQRKVAAQKYSNTLRGTEEYFDFRDKLRSLDKQLMKHDRDLQMLAYKRSVVAQDLMLEMEIRPNFIRSYDDLKKNITEKEDMLHETNLERQDLEEELELLEPDGLAGKSWRSENGSNSGHSVASCHLKDHPQVFNMKELVSARRHAVSRTSVEYAELLNDLGKRFELVNSAPPVHTQLNGTRKGERTILATQSMPQKGVASIDNSDVRLTGKRNFTFPRPPTYAKNDTRRPIGCVSRHELGRDSFNIR